MDLGLELDRELSPAMYLGRHRDEFPADGRAVGAAIAAAAALEECDRNGARRHWRVVVETARQAGRESRRAGVTARRLVTDVERLRTALETVLFDGRLPPDLAAASARFAAKMCTRAVEHALCAYWTARAGRGAGEIVPPFRAYGPEPRLVRGVASRGRTDGGRGASDQMGEAGRPGARP